MKTHLLSALVLFTQLLHAQFNSQNITMLSNYDDSTIAAEPALGIRYNGIWGWSDGNGHEYACIGASNGVHIIEVTNPTTPQLRAFIPGCVTNAIWRELKTYSHYLYMVSDDGGPNCFQIADLSYLPDSVHIVHQADTIIRTSHTIFVDKNRLYCGGVRGGVFSTIPAAMAVFDISNPATPVLLRKLSDDYPGISYVHDMYVRNDTVYASAAYQGMHIYRFDTLTNTFNQIASLTQYPASGYNHSSAITGDGNTLIFADEVPTGLPLKSVDISDFQNVTWKTNFTSTLTSTATPHNPFMKYNHYCIVGYYQDGVQIFDVSNASMPIRTGFFDTNPTDGAGLPNPNYSGCWGVYVDLP
ncbi:MAG TPA: choice-of-anchor B family protein, partial [Bacteroidia bacterium]|nr:choice-of-anchor B family protein [Bacteroidia bacterium]